MDKNMIHIDELVRQRLNGEEEERAGAWLRMRDMLDKNLPTDEGRRLAFGWRKIFGTAALIAAVGAVSYGGYELSHRYRGNAGAAEVAANSPVQSGGKLGTTADAGTGAMGAGNVAKSHITEEAVAGQDAQNSEAVADKSNNTTSTISPSTSGNSTASATASASKSGNNRNRNYSSGNTANTSAGITAITKSNTANSNSRGNNNQPNKSASASNASNSINSQVANNGSANSGSINQPGTTQNTPAAGQANTNAAVNTRVQMVPMVSKVQRLHVDPITGKVTTVVTNLGEGMVAIEHKEHAGSLAQNQAVENQLPELKPAEMPATKSFIGPMPDEHTYAGSNTTAMAGGSKKKDRRDEGNSGQFWRSISDFLNNATEHIGNMEVNPGFVGGINTTFGNYSFLGIHAGFFSEFKFAPQFDARIEGRYMHRFNRSGNSYKDNYTSYQQDPDGYFTQLANSQEFKYSTVSGLTFPVMLQYHTMNKWIFFGGVNLSYVFSINPEYITRSEVIQEGLTSAPETPTPLAVSDFNSRFGVGYLFGAGYEVGGRMRLDVRVTQTVWDNAKGANAQRISNDILKAPGAQVNFSYNFNSKKKTN